MYGAKRDNPTVTPGNHNAGRSLGAQISALDVKLPCPCELVDRGVGYVGSSRGATGIADHDVQLAAILDHRVYEGVDLVLVGDIATQTSTIDAVLSGLLRHPLAQLPASAGDEHGRAQLSQGAGHGPAQVGAAAGNDGHSSMQIEQFLYLHGMPSLRKRF